MSSDAGTPDIIVPVSEQPKPQMREDPPWGGWDLVFIVMVMFGSLVLCLIGIALAVKRFEYPNNGFFQVMSFPLVQFGAQMSAYGVTLAFMFVTATRNSAGGFGQAIKWSWPRSWAAFLGLGIVFAIGLQVLAHFVPLPKENEMEVFFQTPLRAWALSIFAVSFVPLMEELFFRGFLYPVLVRRAGIIVAIIITTLAFTSIHVPQLADPHMPFSSTWGAVLLIFIIGLGLTIVRAVKKSVASGVLMHMAYNGFTAVAAMIQTGGFRHLDRLSH